MVFHVTISMTMYLMNTLDSAAWIREKKLWLSWRATDAAGNVNDCMVNVTVQDKLPPIIVCPADLTFDCDFAYDENNLDEFFGEATIIDNCDIFPPTQVLTGELNQCNIGVLTRTISVGEEGTANYASCQQTITFTPLEPFNI